MICMLNNIQEWYAHNGLGSHLNSIQYTEVPDRVKVYLPRPCDLILYDLWTSRERNLYLYNREFKSRSMNLKTAIKHLSKIKVILEDMHIQYRWINEYPILKFLRFRKQEDYYNTLIIRKLLKNHVNYIVIN